jgi:hypothetical protein
MQNLEELKRITKTLSDDEKLSMVESWGWNIETDNDVDDESCNAQFCIYTGIDAKKYK